MLIGPPTHPSDPKACGNASSAAPITAGSGVCGPKQENLFVVTHLLTPVAASQTLCQGSQHALCWYAMLKCVALTEPQTALCGFCVRLVSMSVDLTRQKVAARSSFVGYQCCAVPSTSLRSVPRRGGCVSRILTLDHRYPADCGAQWSRCAVRGACLLPC